MRKIYGVERKVYMLVLDHHTIDSAVSGIIMYLFCFLTLILRLLQNVHADRGCITRRGTSATDPYSEEPVATWSAIEEKAEVNCRRDGYVQGLVGLILSIT
jgi:hypothetical protein